MSVFARLLFVVGLMFQLNAATPDCSGCHRAESSSYQRSKMHGALESPSSFTVLRTHTKLTASVDGYQYTIDRKGEESIYSVSDGQRTITVPIHWAFGGASMGQTYVFERDGKWYESRVSYYKVLDGLDYTMGAQNTKPKTLEEAAGRPMDEESARECFNCHSTNAISNKTLHTEQLTPGVQCQRCHAGASAHAEAAQSHNMAAAKLPSLRKLSTEETSELCGQCHRTWSQIASNGPHGVFNVRFQPYRLTNSKCYDAEDKRIACTACHSPHMPPARVASAYDDKCLVCHSAHADPPTKASARICKIAKENCTTCHMPKIDLPGSHFKFADHEIRIARGGERYPD